MIEENKKIVKSEVALNSPNGESGEHLKKSVVAEKEEKILKFWEEKNIFKKTMEKEATNGDFVFFDGPPFATGIPHSGHILAGTIKDIIPRYQTMKGKRVPRKWGWDCHGLPIENLVEKELSLANKKDIESYGVGKFNEYARSIVFRYADEWKKIIPRSGRWVDMEDDYRTMDATYTESVWWSFKTLYDKGLVYQGFKAMLLCPRCETTLSNFEVNQGYKDITDISVTVTMELKDTPGTYFLAWTTTPWTLPGNVALAVNPEMEYVAVQKEGDSKTYIMAKARVEVVFGKDYKIVKNVKPEEIIGKNYKPVFGYYDNEKLENKEKAWRVYGASFVTPEDGTGIVHIAPAFGEDDMNLGKQNGLPFVQHVNKDGTFKAEVKDFAGMKVKPIEDHQKTDVEIIKFLAKQGILFAKEKIVHSYPHCWRCATPLLNFATTSWFVKVTDLKDNLQKINSNINWTPEDIRDGRFGKWLEGARDWAISRSRYWGAPLPVWEKENGEKVVVGSVEDLKKYIGKRNDIFLMRHGESFANKKGVICYEGEANDHLTDEGKKQIKNSISELKEKKIDLIISSPFQRTKETAELVAEGLGLSTDNIIYEGRIEEIRCKNADGKSWKDFDLRKGSDAELLGDFYHRTMQFLFEINEKYEGKNILVVSHGGPIIAMKLASVGYTQEYVSKHLDDKIIENAEIIETGFVSVPHNEIYELDLHRPYIDDVFLKDESGKQMKRIPEVFDCWYESGSMSFAQYHYPFENKKEVESGQIFPADFIAEGLDQTRGWFYTLLVLSAGLFDKTPYKQVVVNGLVLAEDGRKMSKSLNNYPDLMDVINKFGADALRYYLVSSPLVKAEDFNFSEKGVEDVYKKLIQKTYNVLSFYEMYPVEVKGKPKETVLDTWILNKLNELTETITTSLNKYELDRASRPIMDFVDDLSTWYVRRSRDRFKSDNQEIRMGASYYTAMVLKEFTKVIAPFVPFLADEVYRRVGGEKESVHLENWPILREVDQKIIDDMEAVRKIVTVALELRQKSGHKVRQPLSRLKIKDLRFKNNAEILEIIKDELNVKEVVFDEKIEGELWLDTVLTEELRNEGVARDIIRGIQDVRKKENLSPNDSVKLIVCSTEKVKKVIKTFEMMIKTPTQVDGISYSDDKQTHGITVEGGEVTVTIVR